MFLLGIVIQSPVSWVKGSKDGLCPLEKLEAVRKKMKPVNKLHVIDGGDHSFKISKKHLQINGSTQDEVEDLAVQSIAEFISTSLGERWHLFLHGFFFWMYYRGGM